MTVGTPTADPPAGSLDFGPDSVFLHRSAHRLTHARGAAARLPTHADGGWATLPQRVRATLADRDPAGPDLVVGALPFDADHPGELVLPTAVRREDTTAPREHAAGHRAGIGIPLHRREVPTPSTYRAGVRSALAQLAAGAVSKVVLARTVELVADRSIDIDALVGRLAARDPHVHTFAVRGPDPEGGPVLVGASPELLVAKHGARVTSHPLAGSAARAADREEDRRRANELMRSAKDSREHAEVVEMIVETLRPFCADLHVPRTPTLVRTATMWHLGTRIAGRLVDPSVSSTDLVTALHPTPAVCGRPTDSARSLIDLIEPFDRGHYTGAVGWCDAAGDGEWVVAVRCAEVRADSIRLFAGAGIVTGSDPSAELAETSAKLRTLYQALGLEEGGE